MSHLQSRGHGDDSNREDCDGCGDPGKSVDCWRGDLKMATVTEPYGLTASRSMLVK